MARNAKTAVDDYRLRDLIERVEYAYDLVERVGLDGTVGGILTPALDGRLATHQRLLRALDFAHGALRDAFGYLVDLRE
jgi:hypothetical protein